MKKSIFGYCVDINSQMPIHSLEEELALYPNLKSRDGRKKITIKISQKKHKGFHLYKPFFYRATECGFILKYRHANIHWDLSHLKTDEIKVDLRIKKTYSSKLDFIDRSISMDHKSFIDNLGQFLHEKIFIPSTFFFEDKVILHGASIFNPKYEGAVVFGGLGGVGKTSSLLNFSKNNETFFLSDDLVAVDSNNRIYPNFSHPKIYAYNTVGSRELETILLHNKSFFNKLHWKIRSRVGKSWVRRTISPNLIYRTKYIEPKLSKNIFIYRSLSSNAILSQIIDNVKSAGLEYRIIMNEFSGFFNFLNLYEYNAINMGIPLVLDLQKIKHNIFFCYNKIFNFSDNFLITIPMDVSHKNFIKFFENEFSRLLDG